MSRSHPLIFKVFPALGQNLKGWLGLNSSHPLIFKVFPALSRKEQT